MDEIDDWRRVAEPSTLASAVMDVSAVSDAIGQLQAEELVSFLKHSARDMEVRS